MLVDAVALDDPNIDTTRVTQQAVSNQLQRLTDQQVVHARRDGQRVFCKIIDPCVPGLMDFGVLPDLPARLRATRYGPFAERLLDLRSGGRRPYTFMTADLLTWHA